LQHLITSPLSLEFMSLVTSQCFVSFGHCMELQGIIITLFY